LELKEIEVLGEIRWNQKILLHVGFFSRTLDVEKAVDVVSVMIFETKKGDAITVAHLTILHPNVTKGMEVGLDRKQTKVKRLHHEKIRHLVEPNLKFNPLPTRSPCLPFWRKRIGC